MPGMYLTEAELDVISDNEMSHELVALYVRVFRKHMDYATGVVGKARRLSYQQVREWLRYTPKRGSKRPALEYDNSKIKRLIDDLLARGLLARVGAAGQMIYRLPFAQTDLVSSQEERPRSATDERTAKRSNDDGLSTDERHTDLGYERPTSESPRNNSLSGAASEKFSMREDWQVVDQEEFSLDCGLRNVYWNPAGSAAQEAVRLEFVSFGIARGDELSQKEWEHRFLTSVVYAAQRGGLPYAGQ